MSDAPFPQTTSTPFEVYVQRRDELSRAKHLVDVLESEVHVQPAAHTYVNLRQKIKRMEYELNMWYFEALRGATYALPVDFDSDLRTELEHIERNVLKPGELYLVYHSHLHKLISHLTRLKSHATPNVEDLQQLLLAEKYNQALRGPGAMAAPSGGNSMMLPRVGGGEPHSGGMSRRRAAMYDV